MVRRIAVSAALLLMSVLPAPAQEMQGIWVLSGPVTPTCVIIQFINTLAGSCKSAEAEGTLNGKIEGRSVLFVYSWTALGDNSTGKFAFNGKLKDDTITGVMTGGAEPEPFTATRQKPGAKAADASPAINNQPSNSTTSGN